MEFMESAQNILALHGIGDKTMLQTPKPRLQERNNKPSG